MFELGPDHALFSLTTPFPKKGLTRITKHDLGHSSYAPGLNSTFDIVVARVKPGLVKCVNECKNKLSNF